MALETLLAAGNTAGSSADKSVPQMAIHTLVLSGKGRVVVETKLNGSNYTPTNELTTNAPLIQLHGPLTYRVRRLAAFAPISSADSPDSCGVDIYEEAIGAVTQTAPNVTRGGGAIDPNTQRVTLATDGPGVAALAAIDSKTPALVNGARPVGATPRTCVGSFRFSATTTSRTLAELVATDAAGVIPAGAVTCELQADGGTIRIGRFAAKPATSSSGYRLDDGAEKMIDTAFSAVTIAAASTVPVNCAFFDRV